MWPLIGALLVLAQAGVARETEIDAARTFSQYRSGLVVLESAKRDPLRAEAVWKSELHRKDQPTRVMSRNYHYFVSGGVSKLVVRTEGVRGEGVDIQDAEHYFAFGNSPENPHFSLAYAGDPVGPAYHNYDIAMSYLLSSSYMFRGKKMSELVSAPGFVARQAWRSVGDDSELVRLEFTCPAARGEPRSSLTSRPLGGWLLLEPGKGWALRGLDIQSDNGAGVDIFKVRIDYAPVDDFPPVPKTVAHDYIAPNGSSHNIVLEFSKVDHEATPARELTLDYYGLGDFRLPPTSGSNRLPYLLFGVSAVSLCVWGVLKSRQRARAAG